MTSHPFDAAAPDYDRGFTKEQPGRWFRDAVWQLVTPRFERAERVLDLGCGTGEDAVFLAGQGKRVRAVDLSAGMLEKARRKAEGAGLAERISFVNADLAQLTLDGEEPFDGLLSNFGPLNCVEELEPLAEVLAHCLRPGAPAILVVMGPWCPWEIAWYLLHARIGTAFRRFRAGLEAPVGGGGKTIPVWYHSPGRLTRALRPYFEREELVGIGSVLPPPYLSGVVQKAPRLFGGLAPLDRRLGRVFPFNRWNDHYVLILRRKA